MLRVPSQSLKALRHAVTYAVLPLVLSVSAIAQTTSPTAPVPPTPTPVILSTTQVSSGAVCAQQLNNAIFDFADAANTAADNALIANITANAASVAIFGISEAIAIANGTAFGTMSGGLAAAALGDPALAAAPGLTTASVAAGALSGFGIADAVSIAFQIGEFAAEATALGFDGTANTANTNAAALTRTAAGLPFCDQEFAGTVKVNAGGLNVTGVSIFNNDVGIDGNLAISGEFTANQVNTSQGISAHGGAIFLGNPDGVSFFEGITLGGGALAGAGFGGALAFTGDVSAIAIGNGASAAAVNSLALGTGANASAVGATALGQNSLASGTGSIAIGNAMSTGTNSIAIGTGAVATGSVAIGVGAVASGGGTAIGDFATANVGTNSAAFGTNATATRSNQQVFGTASNTYTMPGITSSASRASQSGLLEVTTTDAAGNLATDGGAIFNAIARVQAGVAIAMAVETPELATGEKFGIRLGWGGFDSFQSDANAVGASAIGVLGRNLFVQGDRLALDAGVGWGWSEFQDYDQSGVIAGRAGLQFTW